MQGSPRELVLDEPTSLSLAIDHGQFIVSDRGADIDIDAYSDESQRIGLASWTTGVAVFCDSHWTSATSVVLTRVESEPELDLTVFDRVASAGFECATGELTVFTPEETGFREAILQIPTGRYALLACGDRFNTGDDYGDNGEDRYALWLWPTDDLEPPKGLRVPPAVR